MTFLSRLFGSKKPQSEMNDSDLIEAGACPNCWGRMEYDNKFIEYYEDQTKANISNDKAHQKAFIQQFVETHVTGIHLKSEGDQLSCPKCKGKYKHVSSKAN